MTNKDKQMKPSKIMHSIIGKIDKLAIGETDESRIALLKRIHEQLNAVNTIITEKG